MTSVACWPIVATRMVLAVSVLLASLLWVLASHPAAAQDLTFYVNSTVDASDATPGDGICATIGNVCTIRAAFEEANHPNATGTEYIIINQPGTYMLNDQLVITGQNIFIYGTGDPRDVIIDGGNVNRVIDIGAATVSIFSVTLRGGRNEQSVVVPTHYHGGAIHNHGTLTLSNVIIQDSVSEDVQGAPGGCTTVCGGGLYNANTAVLEDVTFVSNRASLDGGAIHNGGTLNVTNATFSDNAAEWGTGAAVSNTGMATMLHTTVAWNITGTGTAIGVTGGSLTLTASIVSNNIASKGGCGGTVTDGGYNISWDHDAEVLDTSCPGVNEDPLLDPARLQDNGGTTPTFNLLAGSAAIDVIPIASCLVTTDQRGVPRPQLDGCDAGAVEWVYTVEAQFTDLLAAISALPFRTDASTAASIRRNLTAIASVAQWLESTGQTSLSCVMLVRLDLEIRSQVAKRRISTQDAQVIYDRTSQLRTSLGC